jgi:hypothetical protein
MLSLLVLKRVNRLEIQSVMLVFKTPLVCCCPSTFSLTSPPSPLPKVNIHCIQTVCGWGGGMGVLSCAVDHILQAFYTLFLIRFRTYKIASTPQTKMTSKEDMVTTHKNILFIYGIQKK